MLVQFSVEQFWQFLLHKTYICVLKAIQATKVWPTFLVYLPVCLLMLTCWLAEWGAAIFCVCSAFINIPLLGDKLMSPGSSDCYITTFVSHIRHFLCYITVGAAHHTLWTTFAANRQTILEWSGILVLFWLVDGGLVVRSWRLFSTTKMMFSVIRYYKVIPLCRLFNLFRHSNCHAPEIRSTAPSRWALRFCESGAELRGQTSGNK